MIPCPFIRRVISYGYSHQIGIPAIYQSEVAASGGGRLKAEAVELDMYHYELEESCWDFLNMVSKIS